MKRAILPVQLSLSIKNQFLIFQIPLQVGYLNLLDIFRFIFRQLRMTFFHKIMQMHNTILQRVKQSLNVKMINLEKII